MAFLLALLLSLIAPLDSTGGPIGVVAAPADSTGGPSGLVATPADSTGGPSGN